jgi:hypothetical protein
MLNQQHMRSVARKVTLDAATATHVIYSASSVAERIVGQFLLKKRFLVLVAYSSTFVNHAATFVVYASTFVDKLSLFVDYAPTVHCWWCCLRCIIQGCS